MQMILSHGFHLHTRADGRPGAPAVLLINSLGTDLRMWDGVADELAADFRVIRFDKPGHGLSEADPDPAGMTRLARHAQSVLDAHGAETAHVVGLSVGGQIAMAMAAEAPERLGKLVLSNTAARIGTAESWTARISALRADGIAALANGVLERWFPAHWRAGNAAALAGWRMMLSRTDPEGYLACCRALADADLTATCRAIRHGTFVIAGGEDAATPPETVRATAALIPGAGFCCIDDAGHLPPVEQPGRYAAALRAFLGD